MNGSEIVKTIEDELFLKGISKAEFYKETSMTSTTLSNWRSGIYQPSPAKLHTIADYLGITYEELIGGKDDDDVLELRELLRSRQDLRILLESAKDAPASSVYALISQMEKFKENTN